MQTELNLNRRAALYCDQLMRREDELKIAHELTSRGTTIVDFGVEARGGIEAGLALAKLSMSALGEVQLGPSRVRLGPWPLILTRTDHPVAACMASQYAGWQLATEDYFGMGSGPMRAAAGREELFDTIGQREQSDRIVGVIESSAFPTDTVCDKIADDCGVAAEAVTLCVVPTKSYAGTVQIVARSVETAMHKLFDLGFDLHRVEAGFGAAPLPPLAANDLAAIGRTNDAILYGGEVTLWVRGDDQSLAKVVANIPSNSSKDHGRPFAAIFEQYNRDFYRIDPHLFSPAVISLVNVDTGNTFRAGELLPDVLAASFA